MFLGKKPELWAPLRSRWRSSWSHGAQPGQQVKCDLKTLVQGSQDGDAHRGGNPGASPCPLSRGCCQVAGIG